MAWTSQTLCELFWQRRYKQEILARKSGLDQGAISRALKGKEPISRATADKLGPFFDISGRALYVLHNSAIAHEKLVHGAITLNEAERWISNCKRLLQSGEMPDYIRRQVQATRRELQELEYVLLEARHEHGLISDEEWRARNPLAEEAG